MLFNGRKIFLITVYNPLILLLVGKNAHFMRVTSSFHFWLFAILHTRQAMLGVL